MKFNLFYILILSVFIGRAQNKIIQLANHKFNTTCNDVWAYTDELGNENTAATPVPITVDTTAPTVTVTSDKNSTIAKLSNLVVETPALESHQLMKTIYEQYSYILFDYVTESVVTNLELDRAVITHNHSILE